MDIDATKVLPSCPQCSRKILPFMGGSNAGHWFHAHTLDIRCLEADVIKTNNEKAVA